jgi:hypothetical protein
MRSRSILRIVAVGALAVVAVVLLIGSFGSGDSSKAAESETWAGSFCAVVIDYLGALNGVATTLKAEGVNEATLPVAVNGAVSSTQIFGSDLRRLGPPPVSETEAKQHLDTLSTQLAANGDKIRAATTDVSTPTDLLNAISVVSSTLVTAKNQVTHTVDELRALDPKGKLHDAFENADSCRTLAGS